MLQLLQSYKVLFNIAFCFHCSLQFSLGYTTVFEKRFVFKILQGAVILALSSLFRNFANTFSLGINQLVDASSSEITSYINWAYWTIYLAACVNQLLLSITFLIFIK